MLDDWLQSVLACVAAADFVTLKTSSFFVPSWILTGGEGSFAIEMNEGDQKIQERACEPKTE